METMKSIVKKIVYVFLCLPIAKTTLIAQMPVDASLISNQTISTATPLATTVSPTESVTNITSQTSPQALPNQTTVFPSQAIEVGSFATQNTQLQEDANIYLNFENASLTSVLNYLGEQKKINIIPHKDLENAKVSLSTRNPLTMTRAWDVLLTLLEMNGFTLIKVGNIYRVVPNSNNTQEPLPTYSSGGGVEPENLPDSDLVVRYVYFFKNIKEEMALGILKNMIEEKNIITNKDLNACIIKDQCLNIKAAMKIVKELDSGGLREAIEIIALKWANADNVKKLFDEVIGTEKAEERVIRFSAFQQKESTFFSSNTKILAEPVKNSLILLGTQKSLDKIKDFIYKYIDVPIDNAESRLHIKELRYVRAQDIKPILDDLLRPPKAAAEKGIAIEGGYKVFEDVIISAEVDDEGGEADVSKRGGGNRLFVACNKEDWNRLESFVEKLDKPQPQVAVEVMVVDANIGQIKELSSQLFNLKGKPIAHGVNAEFTNLSGTKPKMGTIPPNSIDTSYMQIPNAYEDPEGPSYMTLGKAMLSSDKNAVDNIWSMIKTVMKTNNSQAVFQPYVIANNNQKCVVSVDTTVRVKGKLDTNRTSSNAVNLYENMSAVIKVELTPYINLTGTIDLSLDVSIDEFREEQVGETATKTNRKLVTKTSMATGEVLVLGGLTNSKLVETQYKTPILGDIPIIGTLFKSKRKTKDESNLYIFLRPSIIKPRFEGAPDEYTQLKLDYAKYQIMKNDVYIHDRDPIQRWFFKPSNQSIKQRLNDYSSGILRPIDKYTYGVDRPKSVNMQEDPYYRASETLDKERARRKEMKLKKQTILSAYPTQAPTTTAIN
jgi:general secretion pathway protein D